MSNRKSENSEAKKASRKKNFYRVLALVLAFLMVGGGLVSVVYSLIASAFAAEYYTEDMQISVGLMYGSGVTVGFETTTTDGYVIGSQTLAGQAKSFVPLWYITDTTVSVTSDANLKKSDMTYSITSSSSPVIGGYHIEINRNIDSRDEAELLVSDINNRFSGNIYAFPAYVDGYYRIRIGEYGSSDSAQTDLKSVETLFNENLTIVAPSASGVSLINPNSDRILFEYDCDKNSYLGLKAAPSKNGEETYIKTPAANLYDGIFTYKRYIYGGVDGVSVINVLPLESYVAGVLPYEISNSWPIEVQKAFAISVRSYTIANLGRHATSYDFDICNNQHCQMYKGIGRINDSVKKAVQATKGIVMSYNGEVVSAYYSSSTGGTTVGYHDAWGGTKKEYLTAVKTPWEDYMNHNNGFWISEVSPTELAAYLKEKGYNINGKVTNIEIVKTAENSSYVYSLKITDSNGNSEIISKTDTVRTTLTKYLKSANFVVGKGSVAYTVDIVSKPVITDKVSDNTQREDKDFGYIKFVDMSVITADGIYKTSINGYISLIGGNGQFYYGKSRIFVMTKQNAAAFVGDEIVDKYLGEEIVNSENAFITEVVDKEVSSTGGTIDKIAYAANSDNFIFVGKGWGHGVGFSQYGAKDLADMGYDYKTIINSYFTNTNLIEYTKLIVPEK